MKLSNGMEVISDCRAPGSRPYLVIPGGARVSNPYPVYGCTCDACETGREDSKALRDLIASYKWQ
jgi:hypothetical protein